jgi:hypothetical protein
MVDQFDTFVVDEASNVVPDILRGEIVKVHNYPKSYKIVPRSNTKNVSYYRIRTYFVKVRKFYYKDVHDLMGFLREGRVGLLANQLDSPYLVRTIAYYSFKSSETTIITGIVTEYLNGRDMSVTVRSPFIDLEVRRDLCLLQLIALGSLVSTGKFTHYDPGLANFVAIETQPTEHKLVLGENTYKVTVPYTLKLIDLERSYISGIEPEYCDSLGDSGITPGVYDPLFDLAWLYDSFVLLFKETQQLDPILSRNGFDKQRHPQYGIRGYPTHIETVHTLAPELSVGINSNEIIETPWAATSGTDITKEQFRDISRGEIIASAHDLKLEFDPERVTDLQYIQKIFRNYTPLTRKRLIELNKTLGALLVNAKLAHISKYTDTFESFFKAWWEMISTSSIIEACILPEPP